jgi:transcription elongation factor Elf1
MTDIKAVNEPQCPCCGSPKWVSVSLDTGFTRRAQCVPCGAIHKPVIGPGWKSPRYNDPDAADPRY